jgi:hypothetical protein
MKPALLLACTLALPVAARESTNYSLAPESTDSGGGRSSSANYTLDSSIGSPAGLATAANFTGKSGYAGQLYDATGVAILAEPATIDETGTRQLAARATLDDATWLDLAAAEVAWSVLDGPLTGISTAGLAGAGSVYQDTPATAQGAWGGFTASLGLTVLDTLPDNFGSYAGDGIDDSWQHQYFGADNPLAAPAADPDGDRQDNRFEFTAGLDPTDPASRFLLWVKAVTGQPDWREIVFEPRLADRTYQVLTALELNAAPWQPLPGVPPTVDDGTRRTVTDTGATAPRKFYRVEITKP